MTTIPTFSKLVSRSCPKRVQYGQIMMLNQVFLNIFVNCFIILQVSFCSAVGLVDEQLYSRQMLVYGHSAQERMLESSVLVLGSGSLAAEIIKNLALAGIGKLTLVEDTTSSESRELLPTRPSIIGDSLSFVQYAHGLNPNAKVSSIDITSLNISTLLLNENYTVIVATDYSFPQLKTINEICRKKGSKFICVNVKGVCGYVFNDFLDSFLVQDTDGEIYSEVPIAQVEIVPSSNNQNILSIRCIDEEKFGYGHGDVLELHLSSGSCIPNRSSSNATLRLQIIEVRGVREVIGQVIYDGVEVDVESFVKETSKGIATIKKVKLPVTISHQSLESQLSAVVIKPQKPSSASDSGPTCMPTNECLPRAKDRALQLTLLACFRTIDSMDTETLQDTNPEDFEGLVEMALVRMGLTDPRAPAKQGGVGSALLSDVTRRFYRGARRLGACPAVTSVIGSIAAQEVVKSCTQVLMPLSQWLFFESLDSLPTASLPDEPFDKASFAEWDPSRMTGSDVELVYGKDIARELATMRLLVVGSGAIGCELLKILAQMGVGTGTGTGFGEGNRDIAEGELEGFGSEEEGQGVWHGMGGGGVVITDMDHIEKSNLNRQLLFRQQHVGLPKAAVAAERIRTIPISRRFVPSSSLNNIENTLDEGAGDDIMNIRALTLKMDDSESSTAVFNNRFWRYTDVVLTALDSVDARRFVDGCCVRHKKWLLDSGTLGTKGNTQPEHCVAWGKNLFEESFGSRIRTLKDLLVAVQSYSQTKGPELVQEEFKSIISPIILNLSADEQSSLLEDLTQLSSRDCEDSSQQQSLEDALLWSTKLFNSKFKHAVNAMLQAHPPDSVEDDEDGVKRPFWGGSRRVPTPTKLDKNNPIHLNFILYGAMLWGRSRGGEGEFYRYHLKKTDEDYDGVIYGLGSVWLVKNLERIFLEESISLGNFNEGSPVNTPEQILDDITINIKTLLGNPKVFNTLIENLTPQEFEKDVAELGHVDFIHAAANLRASVYGIRAVSRLETQKVAGRIIPAIATTTSLVSGLVCLELVKIADERVRFRRKLKSFSDTMTVKYVTDEDRESVLSRFRNAFVNIARPMLAFAQPVAAEKMSVLPGSLSSGGIVTEREKSFFTLWDVLEVVLPYNLCTIQDIEEMIRRKFQSLTISTNEKVDDSDLPKYIKPIIQSVTIQETDALIFADFLPDANARRSYKLTKLLAEPVDLGQVNDNSGEEEDGEFHDHRINEEKKIVLDNSVASKGFLDLIVSCVDEETGWDLQMPAVRVYIHQQDIPEDVIGNLQQEKLSKGRKWSFGAIGNILKKKR